VTVSRDWSTRLKRSKISVAAAAPSAAAAATPATPVIDPGDGGDYRPDVEATDFVKAIDNPYLPFVEGAEWVYEGEAHGERERIDVVVTAQRRQVMGVSATVVVDRAFVNDELVEETADWYAQDVDGNVWYLGEDTVEYEGGEAVSTDGSWEAGVDGALPGIVMPAQPEVGLAYRQEFLAGEAEDMGEVIRTGERLATGMDTFADVLTTEDWTPLEPDVVEEKSYAPGVGLIRETKVAGDESVVELIEYTPPE